MYKLFNSTALRNCTKKCIFHSTDFGEKWFVQQTFLFLKIKFFYLINLKTKYKKGGEEVSRPKISFFHVSKDKFQFSRINVFCANFWFVSIFA